MLRWIGCGLLAVGMLGCAAGVGGAGGRGTGAEYWARRGAHRTELSSDAPVPNAWESPGDLPGVEAVHYVSEGRRLKAYLLRPEVAADGAPAPALLYLHGNFALGEDSIAAVRDFVAAGFVVLLPTYRGEQGNPGRFELLYGEVADAAAAARHLSALPGVDPGRVHAIGHSVGGAVAALLSLWPDVPLVDTASVGGIYVPETFERWRNMKRNRHLVRFDVRDREEKELRVLGPHVHRMLRPHRAYVGVDDRWFIPNTRAVQARARKHGQPFEMIMVNGDHMTSLPAALARHLAQLQGG